jgi:hypothetical protein
MSKQEKLLEKVKNGRSSTTIDDLLTLMGYYGFTWRTTGHGYFLKHEKLKNIILPHVSKPHGRENKVRKSYVDDCLNAIELLESLERGLNDE